MFYKETKLPYADMINDIRLLDFRATQKTFFTRSRKTSTLV